MTLTMIVTAAVVAVAAATRGTWSPCGLSMISAINPMSERARGHRYAVTCAWFVAGAVVGGALLGLVMAGLAALVALPPGGLWAPALAAVVAVLCLASDRSVAVALPGIPRQVNERWLSAYRRWIYAGGFGVQIGAGFATYVMTAANYLFVAIAVLSAQPLLAGCIGVLFGLVRGLAVQLTARVQSPDQLMRLHRRLAGHAESSLRAVGAVQAVAAAALAAVAGFIALGLPGAVVAGVLAVAAVATVLTSARRDNGTVRLDSAELAPVLQR